MYPDPGPRDKSPTSELKFTCLGDKFITMVTRGRQLAYLLVILFIIGLPIQLYGHSANGERLMTLDNCGIVDISQNRNASEDSVQRGGYPWMVIVRVYGTNFICGGAILNEHWILTAAHCILKPRKTVTYTYDIYVGVHRLSEIHFMEATKHQVSNVIAHEEFNVSYPFSNNIALLRTKTPIDFEGSGGHVNGICLPETMVDPEGVATVHGWEYKRKGDTVMLKDEKVSLISRKTCNEVREVRYHEENISDSELCAVGAPLCEFAYTGSPLIQERKNATNETGVHTLIGIVSYGSFCDSLYPGVYTNVASYVDWMYNTTQQNWTEGEHSLPRYPKMKSGAGDLLCPINPLCSLIVVFIFIFIQSHLNL